MLNVTVYLLLGSFIIVSCENGILQREKRSFFVFPNGGTFKLVVGLAIPVKLGLKQSMAYGINLQYQYAPATNYTQLKDYPPIVAKSQEKRQIQPYNDRTLFYYGLENLMNRYGLNGKSCMLKSICDNAAETLYHSANGLYGQILHIILTPDYGDGETDPDLDIDYVDAYKAGKYGADCLQLYPSCPFGYGFLDMISQFDF